MAHLTFPILNPGLVVDVLVNLKAAALMNLWSSGGSPPPITGRALIDTGSDISAVALPLLRQLQLLPLRSVSTHGVGGTVQVNLFEVSLHILDARNVHQPWLSQPSLVVMELAPGIPFDALIGMDVIRTCKLQVDGPGGNFTLDF